MSSKYKFHNPEGCYFVTFAVISWVDVFTRNVYKVILIESGKFCQQKKDLLIHAYVIMIMTNHLHMIISRNVTHLLVRDCILFEEYPSYQFTKIMMIGYLLLTIVLFAINHF